MLETPLPSDDPPRLPQDETPFAPPTKRWRWWIHLLLIGGYPLLGMTLRSTVIVRGPALSGNVRGLLLVCTFELLLFSLIFGLGWLASHASPEELLFRWRPGWWVVPLGIAYSVAIRLVLLVVIVVVVVFLVTTHTTTTEKMQSFVSANRPNVEKLVSLSAMRSDPSYYWLTVTLVSFVIAGLREEIWRGGTLAALRALWPGAFASRGGQCAGVTLIALLFGVMHFNMGLIAAAMAAVLGWLLGMIMVVHKSIWPAVIAHGLFDATTFAILPWSLEKLRHLH